MAGKNNDEGLSTSAGLVRYMDTDISKFKIEPEKVLGITFAIIVAEALLNYGFLI
ncbi:preprotein translocase subunit Sec61beta [Methanococcus voltae]|uniref:Preprotein translocase subunit Sec61beta n=2 Tax=Methanococcus voltae TaxID=2188 RepID=A0A8J7RHB8_METVO|nr:preprotein translocase subunit Sec61beta [Methanococcus voltae]MBP2200906.1 preprotein translocase subunit Sec61beta [Methanococcus voltae]MCS3921630.1 preprotein translocase subunit Sec61beta [Methanococcus voltae PS]